MHVHDDGRFDADDRRADAQAVPALLELQPPPVKDGVEKIGIDAVEPAAHQLVGEGRQLFGKGQTHGLVGPEQFQAHILDHGDLRARCGGFEFFQAGAVLGELLEQARLFELQALDAVAE
ncbi:MAG TPA: hypothetical protein VIL95_08425 [Bacillota bacterium]